MIFHSLVDRIIAWWYSWWGKDEYSEYPVKEWRVVLACFELLIGFGIPTIAIIILQIRFNILWEFCQHNVSATFILLIVGIIGIALVGLMYSMRPKKSVTQRAWLRGFGHWCE